jgi:ribosomal protein L28
MRVFKPNLQKLKVFKSGSLVSVKFCTRCIKRLKKDNVMGDYIWKKEIYIKPVKSVKPVEKKEKQAIKLETLKKSEEKFSIDSIVGKKN